MAIVAVEGVPHLTWELNYNSAEEEVKTNLEIIRDYVEKYDGQLDKALKNLQYKIMEEAPPPGDVDYEHVNQDIETTKPNKPSRPVFDDTNDIEKPTRNDLIDVTIPDFPSVPSFNIVPPTETFEYEEDLYESNILASLQTHAYNWLSNGGIELDTVMQTAIDATFSRSRARLEEEYEKQMTIALGFYSSRGWSLHNGAQNALIQNVNNEHTRRVDDLNDELTAKEAEFKVRNREFLLTFSKELETILMDYSDKVANRLYEAAKTSVVLLYDIYKSRVEAYVAQVDGVKAEIEAQSTIVDAQININKGLTEIYGMDVERYKAEVSAIVDVIDAQAKVYAADLSGYDSDIKWANALMDSRVEKLKAMVAQSTDITGLQIKEAEVKLQAFINSLGLNIEVAKAISSFMTQLVASSLGALNTHIGMSDSANRSFGSSYSHSESLGNTRSIGETHGYTGTS